MEKLIKRRLRKMKGRKDEKAVVKFNEDQLKQLDIEKRPKSNLKSNLVSKSLTPYPRLDSIQKIETNTFPNSYRTDYDQMTIGLELLKASSGIQTPSAPSMSSKSEESPPIEYPYLPVILEATTEIKFEEKIDINQNDISEALDVWKDMYNGNKVYEPFFLIIYLCTGISAKNVGDGKTWTSTYKGKLEFRTDIRIFETNDKVYKISMKTSVKNTQCTVSFYISFRKTKQRCSRLQDWIPNLREKKSRQYLSRFLLKGHNINRDLFERELILSRNKDCVL